MCFSKPKIPAPPEPPPAPVMMKDPTAVTQMAVQSQKNRLKKNAGVMAAIRTTGSGLSSPAETVKKSLLGG